MKDHMDVRSVESDSRGKTNLCLIGELTPMRGLTLVLHVTRLLKGTITWWPTSAVMKETDVFGARTVTRSLSYHLR
jgi:hypothetical protein